MVDDLNFIVFVSFDVNKQDHLLVLFCLLIGVIEVVIMFYDFDYSNVLVGCL